ncbi:MAG: class I SAM-dependent methyltransferase [Candidatus Nanopelagicales bacterium]
MTDGLRDLRERYNGAVALSYEAQRVRTGQWKEEERLLALYLDEYEPDTVLDVPCGTGRFFGLYEERGIEADGIDMSHDMLELARERGWGGVRTGDIFAIDAGDDEYDMAVCFRLLNWMTEDECVAALTELGRVADLVVVSITVGYGNNGRTVAQPPTVFRDAGLAELTGADIIVRPEWTYRVAVLGAE